MNGPFQACAHRFKKMAYDNHQAVSAIWPFGLCVSMYNTLDEDNYYDVCGDRSTERGHKDYGMCQAGASATASKVCVKPGPRLVRCVLSRGHS